ncbi:MAG: beta-galactosidase [Anaerolineae bacterium]|nr:beta-galactosidase [Anaerolineae bacterium]MDW8299726.1 beta-galactosidase [Anaerolineae bacterium]
MSIQPLTRRLLGVAYYPEHWHESRWAEDAKLLREAGISVVRMMEFAWDKLEPAEGQFNFDWMDRALDVFQTAGIQAILCTPTPTPPAWLVAAHPDILRVDERTGLRDSFGSRRSVTCHAPAYLEACDRIVTAIADRWGKHPNVIGWQIDNEFGCHNSTQDISDHARRAFQAWCKAKYGTLEALNAAWGTQFWSATYTDWSQIPVPAPTTAAHNPSLLLDFRRFSSQSWVAFQRRQIEILRPRIGDQRFITHNFMLRFFDLDYYALAADLDFVGYDNYLHGMSGPMEAAFNLDLMRGMKAGRPFWIMEQQPGSVNWTPYNPPVPPGQVRTWTHQAFAHGAEAVLYFRDRAVNIGQEQYHAGLLKHDGTPDRGWHEAKAVSEDLAKHPLLKRGKAPVAILFDYEDLWTLRLDPHNAAFSYYQVALDLYRPLWEKHIPVDILPRDADLSGYAAVFVPSPALINEAHLAKWRAYVEQGGNLVVTFRAFFKNPSNTWTDQPMPAGGLSELLGMTVDEFLSIPPVPSVGWRLPDDPTADWDDERGAHVSDIAAKTTGIGFTEGFGVPPKLRYRLWAEVLKPTTAEVLMRYTDGYYEGAPAATMNKVGHGAAFYIGCWTEPLIPRSIWQALDLARFEVEDKELPRGQTFELITLYDSDNKPVQVRINHSKRTVTFVEQTS